MKRSDDLLAGLDDIDWAALGQAYGSAEDVPGQLRTGGRAKPGGPGERLQQPVQQHLPTFDQNNPDGAKCIEKAILPAGHTGPLIDRCQPGRCHNSAIAPDHLKIWQSEETGLLTLLNTPKIAPCHREQLNHQLHDVRSVIRTAHR
ncbi:hypothetical protein OHS59_12610 [Streptomyces sp. NBC_00414]|uniref:hypothetical protein n=1 Tax=Streptomyces sp. NBC_00414 TaxID=2975739 RepID=UPI002E233C95